MKGTEMTAKEHLFKAAENVAKYGWFSFPFTRSGDNAFDYWLQYWGEEGKYVGDEQLVLSFLFAAHSYPKGYQHVGY
jgi:hypothetical protein